VRVSPDEKREGGLVLWAAIVYPRNLESNMTKSLLRRMTSGLLFILLAAGLAVPAAKKNITVTLERKEIRDMDSSGLILVVFLELANSARSAFSLTEYDYRVVVEGTDYFALKTSLESPIPVEKNSATHISLPVKITYPDLLERVPVVAGLPKAACYVTGLLIFADSRGKQEKIPFAFSGDFPIYQDLEVEVKPLAVKTLTIGGTEFTLSFSFRNRNSFEVTLKKLAYKFEADGRTLAEGNIPGEKKMESQGEASFNVPVMLDFFEVGREAFDILSQPAAAFLLSGTSGIDSIWGEFRLSFAQKGDVPIVRVQ
jgi:Late embryogenesis abundant protein